MAVLPASTDAVSQSHHFQDMGNDSDFEGELTAVICSDLDHATYSCCSCIEALSSAIVATIGC